MGEFIQRELVFIHFGSNLIKTDNLFISSAIANSCNIGIIIRGSTLFEFKTKHNILKYES